jgi:hypothetical protein
MESAPLPPPPPRKPAFGWQRDETSRLIWIATALAGTVALLVSVLAVPPDAFDGLLIAMVVCVAIVLPVAVVVMVAARNVSLQPIPTDYNNAALWGLTHLCEMATLIAIGAALAHVRWIVAGTFALVIILMWILLLVGLGGSDGEARPSTNSPDG